jgi:DNA polymerase III alpha subunit
MFVPLHAKSDCSLGFGTAPVEALVAHAARLGYRALALTDLESLSGQVRFRRCCRAAGLRALCGLELRPGFDGRRQPGRRDGRLLLLAQGAAGWRSLCRIVSRRRGGIGSGEGRLGRDPLPLVARHAEGLFALSDDARVLRRLLESGAFAEGRLGLLLVRPGDGARERELLGAARELGVRIVADLDAVLLEEQDHELHLLQLAVRAGLPFARAAGIPGAASRERFLRGPDEAAALFADLPEAVRASEELAEACRFELAGRAELPSLELPPGEEPATRLLALCREGLERRGLAGSSAHCERLAAELATIERLGLSGFFLVLAALLERCRLEAIPVLARGSAVSSLALHLLGASPIDPLAQGLLFERFLHTGKSRWPDVDLDLPWHRRDELIDWAYRRFGRDRVALVSAHHRLQRRSALREGLKALGVRPALIEALSQRLPPDELAVEDVDFLDLATDGDLSGALQPLDAAGAPLPAGALSLVQRLVGRPHHLAAHPGGLVVSGHPLADQLPLELAPKGVVCTQLDMEACAELGVVKIDLLGNRALSEVEETLRLCAPGTSPDLWRLPREDAAALQLVDDAQTLGCSQLESPAMRSLLARLPIRRQSDLCAALALIRPGAAAGQAKARFVRRALGEESREPEDPLLAVRVAETQGLLLYEEDLMVLLAEIGGLDLGEADELRAAIVRAGGDEAELALLRERFLGGSPVGGARARRAWDEAVRFAAYSFNKAHAASYAELAYLCAYCKAHHPIELACALLNHHQGLYPRRTLAADLIRRGVRLLPPSVIRSAYPSTLEEGSVRVGLGRIKGLSRRSCDRLLEERRGGYADLADLLARVKLPARELGALVLAGAADGLAPLRAATYPFAHEAVLQHLRAGRPSAELRSLPLELPAGGDPSRRQLYQALVRVQNELRYLEMHLEAHPMALLRGEAARYGCLTVAEASAAAKDAHLLLAVTLAAMRRVPTRAGPMLFLSLEDESGLLEAALLPPGYARLAPEVTTPGPYLVEGQLRRDHGAAHLEVIALAPFKERERPFGRPGTRGLAGG